MIFFSLRSVKRGVAGRSRARKRNGEDTAWISATGQLDHQTIQLYSPRPMSNIGLAWSLCTITC